MSLAHLAGWIAPQRIENTERHNVRRKFRFSQNQTFSTMPMVGLANYDVGVPGLWDCSRYREGSDNGKSDNLFNVVRLSSWSWWWIPTPITGVPMENGECLTELKPNCHATYWVTYQWNTMLSQLTMFGKIQTLNCNNIRWWLCLPLLCETYDDYCDRSLERLLWHNSVAISETL